MCVFTEYVILHTRGSHTHTHTHTHLQRYILSVCAPEFHTEVQDAWRMFHHLFGERAPLRDGLERDFQTFIQPSHSGILVSGSEHAVRLTVSRLTSLIDTMDSSVRSPQPPYIPSTLALPSSGPPFASPPPQQPDLDSQIREVIQKISNLPEDHRRALQRGLEEDVKSVLIPRDSSVCDPQREQRIQYFENLDYPREKVVAVLNSLGPEATDNDVLSRLVRVCSHGSAPDTGGRGGQLSNSRPRGLSGELPQPCSVTDPALLRPVVIDGSNVAMRYVSNSRATYICIQRSV